MEIPFHQLVDMRAGTRRDALGEPQYTWVFCKSDKQILLERWLVKRVRLFLHTLRNCATVLPIPGGSEGGAADAVQVSAVRVQLAWPSGKVVREQNEPFRVQRTGDI